MSRPPPAGLRDANAAVAAAAVAAAPPVAAVLVAAGHGRRAGGPKALLVDAAGQRWWVAQALALRAAGCAPVAAVLHPAAIDTAGAARVPDGVMTLAGDPEGSLFSSLQAGLAALAAAGASSSAVVVLPVDCPWPGDAVLAALRAAFAANPAARAARPVAYDPASDRLRGGHPLLLAATAAAALRHLSADHRLDRWWATLPLVERLDVAVATAAILANRNAG